MKWSKLLVVMLAVLLRVHSVPAQEEASGEGFVGHGVAKITGGDLAGARQNALADAQKKIMLEAVCAQLPMPAVAAHFTALMNLFDRPEAYLERFKIVSENTLPDLYQVTLQGFVQQNMIRQELAALGIVKPEQEKMKMLLMLAEKDVAPGNETYWWSSSSDAAASRYGAQQKLEKYFAEKGTGIVNPLEALNKSALQNIGQSPDPDAESACQAAAELGAHIVLIGKAVFTRVKPQPPSQGASIQCELSARALDVRSRSLIVQAATYALGTQADETSAALEAVEKACSRLTEQITDTLFQQTRNIHEYSIKLIFNKPVTEGEARESMNAFKSVLTGIELVEIAGGGDNAVWTAKVTSPAESAEALQKKFGSGVAGYVTRVMSVYGNVIEIRVTPIKRH